MGKEARQLREEKGGHHHHPHITHYQHQTPHTAAKLTHQLLQVWKLWLMAPFWTGLGLYNHEMCVKTCQARFPQNIGLIMCNLGHLINDWVSSNKTIRVAPSTYVRCFFLMVYVFFVSIKTKFILASPQGSQQLVPSSP